MFNMRKSTLLRILALLGLVVTFGSPRADGIIVQVENGHTRYDRDVFVIVGGKIVRVDSAGYAAPHKGGYVIEDGLVVPTDRYGYKLYHRVGLRAE